MAHLEKLLKAGQPDIDPARLYAQLGQLLKTAPNLHGSGPLTQEQNEWLGRAAALIRAGGHNFDKIAFTTAVDHIDSVLRDQNVQTIMAILHRTLATAELQAPADAQGAFIPVGNALDAFAAVGKVLQTAGRDLFIVDPYLDEKILTTFAPLVHEGVPLRLLADAKDHKPTLAPAFAAFTKQFGKARPLQVRVAGAGALHDRLIFVDQVQAWELSQSFNGLAARSHASITRTADELAARKIAAYEVIWNAATPI